MSNLSQTIYVIRHGNTTGTENNLFYGSTDLELTEAGRAEITELKEAGLYPAAEGAQFFTSGMTRTEQTFELIYGDRPHGQVKDLEEIHIGIFEMNTYEEVMAHELGRQWMETVKKGGNVDFPEGDSLEGFEARVARGFKVLRQQASDRVIAVLHGAVISTAMRQLFGDADGNPWKYVPNPAHGFAIRFENGEPASYQAF